MSISAIASEYIGLTEKPKYAVECIDEFSLDKNANLELGRSEAKYIYKEIIGKRVNIDMLEGMDKQVEKRRIQNLNKIFQWLMAKAASNSILKEALESCDFVCRRGPLSRIAAAPYAKGNDYDEGQQLICTKYKGIYFMCEYGGKSEEKEREMNEFQWKMCYLGRKFEQLMTSNDPNKAPDSNAVVDPNAEFNGVFKATLTSQKRPLNIICAGEIDGIIKGIGKKDEFIELKTQIRRMGHGRNFVNKAIRWYFQSHLIGIKRFVVGYHDNFMMNKIDYFSLDELLGICGGPTRCPWKVDVCLNFLHAFLEKIKSELDSLSEDTILVVERGKWGIEFIFTPIGKEYEDYGNYEVISKEFKAHGWKEE